MEEKIEPMSLPVGGKMRKGVLYQHDEETLFLFVAEETGTLACWRLKIGENGMRATAECFVVPAAVLDLLDLKPINFLAGTAKSELTLP